MKQDDQKALIGQLQDMLADPTITLEFRQTLKSSISELRKLDDELSVKKGELHGEQVRRVELAQKCEALELKCRERQWELDSANISTKASRLLIDSLKDAFHATATVPFAQVMDWLTDTLSQVRLQHRHAFRDILGEDGEVLAQAVPGEATSALHVAPLPDARFTLVDTQTLHDCLSLIGSDSFGFKKQLATNIRTALGRMPVPRKVTHENMEYVEISEDGLNLWRSLEKDFPGQYADQELVNRFCVLHAQASARQPMREHFMMSLAEYATDPLGMFSRLKKEDRLSGLRPAMISMILDTLVQIAREDACRKVGIQLVGAGSLEQLSEQELFELEFERLRHYKPVWNGEDSYQTLTEENAWQFWQARGHFEKVSRGLATVAPELFLDKMSEEQRAKTKAFWAQFEKSAAPVVDREHVALKKQELLSIIEDANTKPKLNLNYSCVSCGAWAPHNHPEAHEHEDDCEEIANVQRLGNWRKRLVDLIESASASAQPPGQAN